MLVFALSGGLCGFLYVQHTQTILPGWDPVAYLYAGRRLAEGKDFAFCHPYNASVGPYFTLAGFNVQTSGAGECLYPNYPIGFPLILAASEVLTGWRNASLYVPAVFGFLGVLSTFAFGAALFDVWSGVLGGIILGLTPTFLSFSTSVWADVPSTSLLIGGLAVLVLANRQSARLWQMIGGGLGAGMIGWIVFTRYANGVALLPVTAYLLLLWRNGRLKSRSAQVFGAVTALVALGVLVFNRVYYGGYFATPYSAKHGWYSWSAFSLQYVLGKSPVGAASLLAAGETIWENFKWLLLPAVWGSFRLSTPRMVLIVGVPLVFVGLYAGYAFPARGINARFLLPAFPFLSLAAGYGIRHTIFERWRWWWRGVGVLLIGLVLIVPLKSKLHDLTERNKNAAAYVAGVTDSIAPIVSDAVFLAYDANDTIAYHGGRTTLFYRRMPPPGQGGGQQEQTEFEERLVESVTLLLEEGVPVYYVRDRNPPLWGSFNVLKRHFRVQVLHTTPRIYRIQNPYRGY